ncbi:MAG TPA: hypothetical protein VEX38_06000 [Fimbriimonadaceae bacterium]|nr:hypothetical protein [Fimbriimonadaceae bacterium]
MNLQLWLTEASTLKRASVGFIGACVLSGVLVSYSLGSTLLFSNSAGEATQQSANLTRLIDEARSTISQARDLKAHPATEQSPLATFQASVESTALRHRCKVDEFSVTGDAVPYLSQFANETKAEGWLQTDVKMSLVGSLSSVMACAREFSKSPVPIEFNTMEFTRHEVDLKSGETKIRAQIDLRVLTRASGGTS